MQTVSSPFYTVKRQRVVGDPRLWDLYYFADAESANQFLADARAQGRFGYVLETTQGQIWRVTLNH